METNIYKIAAMEALRFKTDKGNLCVEDLYHLNMKELDALYKSLNKEKQAMSGDSLLDVGTAPTSVDIKIEIVKDVFATKKNANDKKLALAQEKQKKQRIAEIIAAKEDQSLMNMSIEDLKKMLNE